jgi:50S ribosomal protein L16 3-hydroxylase
LIKTGLSALVHPRTKAEFFDRYEKGQPLIVHGDGSTLAELTTLPFLASLDALLRSWPSPVEAHLPDVRDEASAIATNTSDAKKLFNCGMGLLFSEANLVSDVLATWLETIRKNLGLPAMTYGRCLIYATPDGKGTAPHFDHNINFVIQVRGTKVWTLSPNHHVVAPMNRHTMGLDVDPELATYTDLPMPTSMPSDTISVELKPGSVLFVPRGFWHATEAQGDALSLNFTFTAPTWIDLFTAALRSRLVMSPHWRQTADGVSDPENRDAATRRFDHLLLGLVKDLPNWQASDILNATEPPDEF